MATSFRLSLMIPRVNIKLSDHFKATMLPYCFTTSSMMFMVAVKLMDTSSFWILFQDPFWIIVLNFKHIKYFSKPFHVCCLQTVEDWKRQILCYEGNFIAPPHQVTFQRKFFSLSTFCYFFIFFVFIFWST